MPSSNVGLYQTSNVLNQIDTENLTSTVHPLSSSNNMPPQYDMTEAVTSSEPLSYTQVFNEGVQNLHQKWTTKLTGNLESSVFRSFNTIISEENMDNISKIMNKFGSLNWYMKYLQSKY